MAYKAASVYSGTVQTKKKFGIRKKKKREKWNFKFIPDKADKLFLLLIAVLLIFGLIMMFSASFAWGLNDTGDGYFYVKRQAGFAAAGLVIMFAVSFLDYHFFRNKRIVQICFWGAWGLNFVTGLFGSKVADARRWIEIAGVRFQPSELLKIAFIIIFAYIISVNYKHFDKWQFCIIPFAIIMGVTFLVLMLQRHLSAVLLVGVIGLSLMFLSGMDKKIFWKFVGVCAGAAVIFFLAKIAFGSSGFSYISERIQSWRDPTSDTTGSTYQTYNSLLAIGSGGWTGLGFGESRQKYLYLPESQNDFIFSIICEELGFVGALVVVLLFLMFILRGFYIASKAKDKFGMLVAAGITIQIGLQAFLNIMVASNAFPNTGISLPFFSYGGTALLIQLAEMGILLNISRQGDIQK